MFAHNLYQSQIEYLSNSTRREAPFESLWVERRGRMIDLNRKDRAKRYRKSSIFNLQSSIFNSGLSGLGGTNE
jgi:hypothetical protein